MIQLRKTFGNLKHMRHALLQERQMFRFVSRWASHPGNAPVSPADANKNMTSRTANKIRPTAHEWGFGQLVGPIFYDTSSGNSSGTS
eukprot:7872300-Pyramimonas_sp.AAC.1